MTLKPNHVSTTSLASAADPANIEAKEGAGYVYMILRRYREAIARFETVLPAFADGLSPLRLSLARAYMEIRDEANALRVLRGSGLPEDRITAKLSELRQAAGRPR
jgi:predicted Zn-dependent protease